MKDLLNKLKLALSPLLNYLPTKLPQGIEEFDSWSTSIIKASGLPQNDSVAFSLAVMVLHLDSATAYKPKVFFIRSLQKAASNQVVSQVIQDLKAKQEAAKLAAAQQLNAEATALSQAVADGPRL